MYTIYCIFVSSFNMCESNSSTIFKIPNNGNLNNCQTGWKLHTIKKRYNTFPSGNACFKSGNNSCFTFFFFFFGSYSLMFDLYELHIFEFTFEINVSVNIFFKHFDILWRKECICFQIQRTDDYSNNTLFCRQKKVSPTLPSFYKFQLFYL